MLAPRMTLPRPARLLLLVILIYAFCWVKGWPRYYDDDELPPSMRHYSRTSLGPHRVRHEELVVSITTTATDVYTKVAPALLYLSAEDRDPTLLFGDLYMNIAQWPVFDVLHRYSHKFISQSRELGRYRAQLDHVRRSIPLHTLKKDDAQEEQAILDRLKKYKILQTMASAWEYRPDRSWYAFIDDDTYVNRANVLDWLSQYNPSSPWFFGNAGEFEVPDAFAAGGSSFIVSRDIMRELFKYRKDLVKSWQHKIEDSASALELVVNVLQTELKQDMQSVWPGMIGTQPSTLPFSPSLWCERVLMMHRVGVDIASSIWRYEVDRARFAGTPLLYSDLYEHFLQPENLNNTREDWDNLSADPTNAHWNILFENPETTEPEPGRAPNGEESPDACSNSCNNSEWCMQWAYSSIPINNWNDNGRTKCHLSSSIRFGAHSPPRDVIAIADGAAMRKTWTSGWRKDKFMGWAHHQRCKSQQQ